MMDTGLWSLSNTKTCVNYKSLPVIIMIIKLVKFVFLNAVHIILPYIVQPFSEYYFATGGLLE